MASFAEFVGVVTIYQKCVNYIRKTLNASRAFELAEYFSVKRNEEIQELTTGYLIGHYAWLYDRPDFPKVPYVVLKNLLKDDETLVHSEEQIVFGIANWLQYDWPDRWPLMKKLSKAIRYKFLSEDFLSKYAYPRSRNDAMPMISVSAEGFVVYTNNNRIYSYNEFIRNGLKSFNNNNNGNGSANGGKNGGGSKFKEADDSIIANCIPNLLKNASENPDQNTVNRICKKLYLFGLRGNEDRSTWSTNVLRYDGYRLESLPRMQTQTEHRCYQRVITAGGGLIFKYVTQPCVLSNEFQMYNPDTRIWMNLPTAAVPGTYVSAYDMVSLGDKIYLNTAPHYPFNRHAKFAVHVFDQTTGQWLAPPLPPKPIQKQTNACCMAVTDEGVLIVCGGMNVSNYAVNNVHMYDPRIGTWTELNSMPKRRAYSAAVCHNGKLYLSGGIDRLYPDASINDTPPSRTVLTYSMRRCTWHSCKRLIEPKHSHQMLVNGDRIYAIADCRRYSLLESFNTVTYRWQSEFELKEYFDYSATGVFL